MTGASLAQAYNLSVPAIKQEQSNWCWAASTSAVLRYYSVTTTSQCALVMIAKGGTCPNSTGTFYGDVDQLYQRYNRSTGTKVGWLVNFATIKSRIDAGRPLQLRYGYKNSALVQGHIVTAFGYTGTSTVYWIDPDTGLYRSGTWAFLADNDTWRATDTRDNQGV